MNIRADILQIPEANPFQHDTLQRSSLVPPLTQLIERPNQPFVMSISAPFGMGKTSFILMWQQYLKNNNFRTVHFDAWESDHFDDPLIPLIATIIKFIKDCAPAARDAQIRGVLEKVTEYSATIAKKALPAIVKVATAGAIDCAAIAEEVGKIAEEFSKEQIEKYTVEQDKVKQFKESLLNAIQLSADGSTRGPLVIFIDDLDRCKPDFAVRLLERLKHFFSIENLVFVLSIDREQIGTVSQTIFGNALDAKEYLRKFIDLDFQLPLPPRKPIIIQFLTRFDTQGLLNQRAQTISSEQYNVTDLLVTFDKTKTLTLRALEQTICRIGLALKVSPMDRMAFVEALVWLSYIRECDKPIYDKIFEGNLTPQQFVHLVREDPLLNSIKETDSGLHASAFIVGLLFKGPNKEELVELARRISDDPSRRLTAANILTILWDQGYAGKISELMARIEFVGNFS